MRGGTRKSAAARTESPGGEKAQESIGLRSCCGNMARGQRAPAWSKALKVTGPSRTWLQHQEGKSRRKAARAAREEKALEGENPMSACRVKQTDEAVGGASRQEGEKP
jgi:hypothetical protein